MLPSTYTKTHTYTYTHTHTCASVESSCVVIPKSVSFATPLVLRQMLEGLISLWCVCVVMYGVVCVGWVYVMYMCIVMYGVVCEGGCIWFVRGVYRIQLW
jgi:hypothetical protein